MNLTIQGLADERAELQIAPAKSCRNLNFWQALYSARSAVCPDSPNPDEDRDCAQAHREKGLELVRRRDRLIEQRAALGVVPGYDSSTIVAAQSLDGAVRDEFSQVVEDELKSWEFPNARRVFFELATMDISVAGKPRSSNR